MATSRLPPANPMRKPPDSSARADDTTSPGQLRDRGNVRVTARFDLPLQSVNPQQERDLDAYLVTAAELHATV